MTILRHRSPLTCWRWHPGTFAAAYEHSFSDFAPFSAKQPAPVSLLAYMDSLSVCPLIDLTHAPNDDDAGRHGSNFRIVFVRNCCKWEKKGWRRHQPLLFFFSGLVVVGMFCFHWQLYSDQILLTEVEGKNVLANQLQQRYDEVARARESAKSLKIYPNSSYLHEDVRAKSTTRPENVPVATQSRGKAKGKGPLSKLPNLNPVLTTYPLVLPNLREVAENVIAKNKVEVKPINSKYTSMKFLDGGASPCNSKVDVLLLIKTATKNSLNRRLLRKMWANETYLDEVGAKVTYRFLVGTKQFANNLSPELLKEQRDYRDIVLMDYVDVYQNSTYKTMGAMKWMLDKCDQAQYLTLLDDDLFFNAKNLVRFLQNPSKYPKEIADNGTNFNFSTGSTHELFAGIIRPDISYPHREKSSLWYLPYDDYPLKQFPSYCFGMTMIMSKKTVKLIFTSALFVRHMSIDDVYLGLITTKLSLKRTNIGSYGVRFLKNEDCAKQPNFRASVLSIHMKNDLTKMQQFWKDCVT